MAAEARQEQLGGGGFPAHLTTEPDHRISPDLQPNPEKGEFYCKECEFRITRNTKNYIEYGHDRDCSHNRNLGDDSQ